MCATHSSPQRKLNLTFIYYLIAISLGITGGYFQIPLLQDLGSVISQIFIKIFKCISLPIIFLSLIVRLSESHEDFRVRKIWYRILYYTVGTTLIAAIVACILYCLISPPNMGVVASKAIMIQSGMTDTHYLSYLVKLIPANIFSPFLEHQVMGVLFLSILVGIAIGHIPDKDPRSAITGFFKGAHGIFIVITSWIVKIIPIALFGFIITTIVQLKSGTSMAGLGKYLSVVVLANLVQGFIILPLFLYGHKVKAFQAMKGMMPALSVAFFSKSSAGTLPITMDVIERNLGVSPGTSRLVLPLCTSINMNGCAAFIFITVIYLMQNNGMEIGFPTMVLWIFISTIAAIGNAGVPMGCFFLSASLLTGMNVPIELMGLILPFYSLIDMVETALNVWSDSCVTKIIDEKVKKILP